MAFFWGWWGWWCREDEDAPTSPATPMMGPLIDEESGPLRPLLDCPSTSASSLLPEEDAPEEGAASSCTFCLSLLPFPIKAVAFPVAGLALAVVAPSLLSRFESEPLPADAADEDADVSFWEDEQADDDDEDDVVAFPAPHPVDPAEPPELPVLVAEALVTTCACDDDDDPALLALPPPFSIPPPDSEDEDDDEEEEEECWWWSC